MLNMLNYYCCYIVAICYLVHFARPRPNSTFDSNATTDLVPSLISVEQTTDPIMEEVELMEPRIVNGRNVDISLIPYQIHILYHLTLWCGGTIVAKYHVVSATHCFDQPGILTPRLAYTIVAGTTYAYRGESYSVDKIVTHPKYSSINTDYDVAVVRVTRPFDENDNMKPVPLSDVPLEQVHGHEARVSGWGYTKFKGSGSSHLQEIYVPIWPRQNCVDALQPAVITDRMFCAGYVDGSHDACTGDSGGPLVLDGALYGIISWGVECSKPGKPGVYTHVPTVKTWIEETIRTTSL